MSTNKQNSKGGIMSQVFAGAKRDFSVKKRPKKVPEVMETVQDSIPIYTVHEKRNLIEPYKGCFTKTYCIENINYQTASEAEQTAVILKWRAFLNSLGANVEMALTVFNQLTALPSRPQPDPQTN